MQKKSIVAGVMIALLAAGAHAADEWGGLKGRFVVEGTPPKPQPVENVKDPHCVHAKLVDQTVLVSEKGELRNAVVYLRPERGQTLAVHPEDQAALGKPVELANKQCVFTPHVTLVRVGQPMVITNEDPMAHNTKLDLIRNRATNDIIPAGGEVKKVFNEAESKPLPVSCNIHTFMNGYVLVREDPYMAVSGDDGAFEIRRLPAGEHEFQFWHETGYLRDVQTSVGATSRRGRLTLSIKPGETLDLGEIKVPAQLLRE